MVTHLVLFRPRRDLPDTSRRAFLDDLVAAGREIPGIRRIRFGRRLSIGREYERTAPENFTYMLLVEFDDVDDLHAFLAHPAHAPLGERFGDSLEAGVVYDYELWDADALPDL